MNIVFIMTDTQNKSLVGAYGNPAVDTPNLDRLASQGVLFDNAYTTCPLCTPARGGIFTGLYPQVNGAFCNNVAPFAHVALAGTAFRENGYRAGYTGKWHLDGSAYFGDGEPGGGFEPDWWYDGKRYAEDIGPEMFDAYRGTKDAAGLRRAGFDTDTMWGHRVADRAIDFLGSVGDDPFFLAVSFDEPHGPFVAPPEYWEKFDGSEIPEPDNFFASIEGKSELMQIHRSQVTERYGGRTPSWKEFIRAPSHLKWLGCNSYIDREIGRVIDAVDRVHSEDTVVIYTSDHGDQFGSHGLLSKGPMMYQETTNIPLIIRLPGGGSWTGRDGGARVVTNVASHIDLLPTMLDYAGLEQPEVLNGRSMRPLLEGSDGDGAAAGASAGADSSARRFALVSFHRFAINHDSYGEFYPVRCVTDGRAKLIVNLLESDELYDLESDPGEMRNRIDDPELASRRNEMHDWMLEEMDRVRDPFRSHFWGKRRWRSVRSAFYFGGAARGRPKGFTFQPSSVDG